MPIKEPNFMISDVHLYPNGVIIVECKLGNSIFFNLYKSGFLVFSISEAVELIQRQMVMPHHEVSFGRCRCGT